MTPDNPVRFLGTDGLPMAQPRRSAAVDASYDGASLAARELASWHVLPTSADSELLPEQGTLVARSRDLWRNNGIAASGLQTILDNVVGANGLRLSATPDYRLLGRDKAWADAWSEITEGKFRAWAETTACDAGRSLNFAGLTTQLARAGLMNGEGVALPLWLPERASTYATRLLLVEADRLSIPYGRLDGPDLRGGIEIDIYGAPQAYWFRKGHPGDVFTLATNQNEWERVPAYTFWGRKQVIHVHDRERTGMSRGKPILTPVLSQFRQYSHYTESELKASIVNAMIAAFVKSSMSGQELTDLFGGPDQYMKARGEHAVRLKGGAVLPLFPGDEIQPFVPARPATAFDAFTKSVLRHIAAGMNIPYELLLKDFSQTNYSSARAALLEAWRFFIGRRQWLATYWATPVYELWLEEAVNLGQIEAPDFYANRFAYCRCRWIGAGRGWVDPVKEGLAAEKRLQLGLTSLEEECAEQGKDWREVAEQRSSEASLLRTLNLPVPWESGGPAPIGHNSEPPLDAEENQTVDNQTSEGA